MAAISLFSDPQQVVARSGEGVKRYQEANVYKESDTSESIGLTSDNPVNQISNSPTLDVATTQETVDKTTGEMTSDGTEPG